ncbi:MAG: phenylalanine--tRNA ligase beta subunit-related protein [Anaerolineales bacterium]
MQISIGSNWVQTQPDALIGILIMKQVSNPNSHPELQERKHQVETEIREKYAGIQRSELRTDPILAAYDQFYRQFRKTYHLQLQLESVIEGKAIPSVAALVEAMFMAELEDRMLTAGHDLDRVKPPLSIDIATGSEVYTRMNGTQQTLKAGDLYIRDIDGILSSVIYGPDQRTRIQPETSNVLFTTYAVQGIESKDLTAHLEKLRDYVFLFSKDAIVDTLKIITQ